MKIFLSKNHQRQALIALILSIPLFMWLMPFGSFDPRDPGFWLAIAVAVIIELIGNWVFTGIQQRWGTAEKDK